MKLMLWLLTTMALLAAGLVIFQRSQRSDGRAPGPLAGSDHGLRANIALPPLFPGTSDSAADLPAALSKIAASANPMNAPQASSEVKPIPRRLRAGLRPVASLADVGQSSPLAAVESVLWAINHGDTDVLDKLIMLDSAGNQAAGELFSGLAPDVQARFGTPQQMMALLFAHGFNAAGYSVTSEGPNAEGLGGWAVQAIVQLDDGRTLKPTIPLQETNGNWQVEINAAFVNQSRRLLNQVKVPQTP